MSRAAAALLLLALTPAFAFASKPRTPDLVAPAPTFVDVRTARSAADSAAQIAGAARLDPSRDVVEQARALGLPRAADLVLYCA